MNIITHLDNFKELYSCEKIKRYFDITSNKLANIDFNTNKNYGFPYIHFEDSKKFLKWFRKFINHMQKYKEYKKDEKFIFYLDAHFYDPMMPKGRGKFIVLDELKALKGMKDAIIIIHDFDNGLGHITYDGISLDMKLLRKDLLKVNPKFRFYTNELSSCDIITLAEEIGLMLKSKKLYGGKGDYDYDQDRMDNLKYAWSKPEKTYRGLLYCVPKKIKVDGLREIK